MSRRQANSEAFSLFSFQDIITSVTGVIILVMLMLAVELVQRKAVTFEAAQPRAQQESSDRLERIEDQISDIRAMLESGESFIAQIAELPVSSLVQRESELKRTVENLSKDVQQLDVNVVTSRNGLDSGLVSNDLLHLQDERIAAQANIDRLKSQLKSLKDSHKVIYNPNPFSQKSAWLVDLLPGTIRIAEPGKTTQFLEFTDSGTRSAVEQFISWSKQRDKQSEYFVLLLRPKSIRLYEAVHRKIMETGFDSGVDLIEANATVMGPEGEGT